MLLRLLMLLQVIKPSGGQQLLLDCPGKAGLLTLQLL